VATALHAVQTYAAAPDAVFAKYSDRTFLDGRLRAAGGIDPQITELLVDGEGSDRTVRIVSRQSIPASVLPSVVSAIMPGDPVILRTENWRPVDGGFLADFDVVIKNAPASLQGTMTLTAAPGAGSAGSVVTIVGRATVPIPLFGGKIEGVIVDQVDKLLRFEEQYTQQQLGTG